MLKFLLNVFIFRLGAAFVKSTARIGSTDLFSSVTIHTSPAGVSVVKVTPGHYNLESVAKAVDGQLRKYDYKLETETNTPVTPLVIKNFWLKPITLDRD